MNGEGEFSRSGSGPGERGPKLENAGYQSLRKKMVTVIRTQFSAVCPGSGAGREPLNPGALFVLAGEGPHFPKGRSWNG